MRVEIWSDVVCPWCYLGKARFEKALDAFAHRDEVEVVYRSFELDPDAAGSEPTITTLARKYGMTEQQARDAQAQMEERAAADGLSFDMSRLRSGNTGAAHRLIHFAAAEGRQADLVERLHRAYFSEQRDVFDVAELATIAAQAGLDRDKAAAVLAGDDYAEDVAADEAEAHALGITGVPFFVLDRRFGVSGAQTSEVLVRALEQAYEASAAS